MVNRTVMLRTIRACCLAMAFVLPFHSSVSWAADKAPLPRSLGPLTLGMTAKEFSRITGVIPGDCHWCAKNETFAGLNVDKYPKLFPSHLYGGEKYRKNIECGFFEDRLYVIESVPKDRDISPVRNEFSKLFGAPRNEENWENGISRITWEDSSTVLRISFVRVKGEDFPLTLPVGTAHLMRYMDKSLRDAREKQENINPVGKQHND